VRTGRAVAVACAALAVAMLIGVSVGPAGLTLGQVAAALLVKLPWLPHLAVPPVAVIIVWQVRLPRVILGALVGAMLAGSVAEAPVTMIMVAPRPPPAATPSR